VTHPVRPVVAGYLHRSARPVTADPLFVYALAGDYALRAGSPAIDATYSPPLASDESPPDLLGAARIRDGKGDRIGRAASEHQASTRRSVLQDATAEARDGRTSLRGIEARRPDVRDALAIGVGAAWAGVQRDVAAQAVR
jgi:hypothetical protein